MISIRRILCPVDFSETSRHALEHAVVIAKWYDADLSALHVVFPRFVPQPPIFFAEPAPSAGTLDAHAAGEAQLRHWLEDAARSGVRTSTFLDEGQPAPCILRQSSGLPADLIVMGTHGLSGFDRLLLGSVAERVLRKAGCPVLTVPPAVQTAARVPYARVLCPVDFSGSSLKALGFAASLAEESDARLTILHVLDWPEHEGFPSEPFDPPGDRAGVEAIARSRLEALVTDDMRLWCRPEIQIAHGKPYRQILEAAHNERTDLIVIGVRGRNPVDLTLFGSTTNHVVRRASCPVLTLKE